MQRWASVETSFQSAGGPDTYDTVSGTTRVAETYSVMWDGTETKGARVALDHYFVCIEAARERARTNSFAALSRSGVPPPPRRRSPTTARRWPSLSESNLDPETAARPSALSEVGRGTSTGRRRKQATSRWVRWIHVYTSMISLLIVLFFGLTGITLNHPKWIFGQVTNEFGDVQEVDRAVVVPFRSATCRCGRRGWRPTSGLKAP